MAQMLEGPSASTLTRWSALIVIALGIGTLLVYLQGASLFARWSAPLAHAGTLFPPRLGVPAVAFAAGMLFAFCVVMLRPLRRRARPYDRLSLLLAAFVLVAVAYVIAVERGWAMVPSALVAAAWAVSGIMLVVAARAAPLHHSLWLRLPFSIAFAVVTLLLLEVLAAAVASPRFAGLPAWLRRDFALCALGFGALVAAVVALRYHDYVYPLVLGAFIAWLPFAGATPVSPVALWIFGAGMLVLAIAAAFLLARDPRERQPARRRDRAYVDEVPRKSAKRRGRRNEGDSRRYLLEADSSLMRL